MQTIIKKAIEGGWKPNKIQDVYKHPLELVKGASVDISISSLFLDPLFWQALGKACGWTGYECLNCGYTHFGQYGFSECCQNWSSAKSRDRWQYDSYKDFVLLTVNETSLKDHIVGFVTSSSMYSLEISKLLDFDPSTHADCRRVEYQFKINNSIKLSTLNNK